MSAPVVDPPAGPTGPTGPTKRGFRPLRDLPVMLWLTALVVVVLVHPWVPAPRWLMLHLLLLGAVSHAIHVWSQYFADTPLHAAPTEAAAPASACAAQCTPMRSPAATAAAISSVRRCTSWAKLSTIRPKSPGDNSRASGPEMARSRGSTATACHCMRRPSIIGCAFVMPFRALA